MGFINPGSTLDKISCLINIDIQRQDTDTHTKKNVNEELHGCRVSRQTVNDNVTETKDCGLHANILI